MKAVQFHEHGGREVLSVEDVPTPEPGDGRGARPHPLLRAQPLRHRPARERLALAAGASAHPRASSSPATSRRWAAGVEGFREGQAVWVLHEIPCLECEYCLAGTDNLCLRAEMYSVQRPGGYAEYALAPARAVFPLPGPEWHDAAAAGQIVFTTAWHMLMTRAKLRAGETVVVSAVGQRRRPRGRPDREARRRHRDRHRGQRREAGALAGGRCRPRRQLRRTRT